MNHELKGAIGQALHSMEEKRQSDGYYLNMKIPKAKKGDQTLRDFDFKEGEQVTSNGTGPIKMNVSSVVVERWKEFGFWYYRTMSMGVMRQKDIFARGGG
jgi:hypothetical protein